MPVEERQIIGMKYPNIVPEGYCCDKCHAHGVKLWCGDEGEGLDLSITGFIPSSVKKLLCANCAEADQKVFMHDGWKSEYLLKTNGGRYIGCLFPALPAEGKDNLFYGDYEMPSYAILWWDRLPASNPVQVMVYEKKLRLDVIIPEDKVMVFAYKLGITHKSWKLFPALENDRPFPIDKRYTNKQGHHIQVAILVDEEQDFYNFLENFCENERLTLGRQQ